MKLSEEFIHLTDAEKLRMVLGYIKNWEQDAQEKVKKSERDKGEAYALHVLVESFGDWFEEVKK